MSLFVRYTLLRFGLLVLVLAALALIGVRGILLPALAVLISLPLSYVLLARQRNAFAAEVERRVHERQERRAGLRAEMAGEPVAADPVAVEPVAAAPVAAAPLAADPAAVAGADVADDDYLAEQDLAAETATPVEPPGAGADRPQASRTTAAD